MLILVTFHLSLARWVYKAMGLVWTHTASRAVNMLPQKARLPLGAAGAIEVILLGTFITEETADNIRANRAI